MKAEILTIGSELLEPGRVETNSTYLIDQLASAGIPVIFHTSVGDDRSAISDAAGKAISRAEVVLATGGLGPTSDDVTREGFADALGLELYLDEDVLQGIRHRYAVRGLEMPEVNIRQAMIFQDAEILPNPAGTAPGQWVLRPPSGDGKRGNSIILLPGPPSELAAVFETEVLPRLKKQGAAAVYRIKSLRVAGLPESVVEQKVGAIYRRYDNPRTEMLASPGQVEIRLIGRGPGADQADEVIEGLSAKLRHVLGEHIFSESGESLEHVVGMQLRESGKAIAVAESCTGGLITHRLTEIPGSSHYLERGFVTYSNASKVELLGVPEDLIRSQGAVSDQVAKAMASGARTRAGTDLGLAVTGIAGPAGASADKPVGLVFIALCDERETIVRRFQLPGGRSQVKWWTSQMALNLLRLHLLKKRGRLTTND